MSTTQRDVVAILAREALGNARVSAATIVAPDVREAVRMAVEQLDVYVTMQDVMTAYGRTLPRTPHDREVAPGTLVVLASRSSTVFLAVKPTRTAAIPNVAVGLGSRCSGPFAFRGREVTRVGRLLTAVNGLTEVIEERHCVNAATAASLGASLSEWRPQAGE